MARPQPRRLNDEEMKKFAEAAAKQTSKARTPLTVDESKYPLFDIPVNEKRVIYVPNFNDFVYDESLEMDVPRLKMDRGAFHTIRHRGSYTKYRCIGEITEIEGFDGTCPICEAGSDVWDLYNIEYLDIATKKGLDPNKEEDKEALAEDRKKLLKEMVTNGKNVEYTFPIVVIEVANGTLNPVIDPATKMPKGRVEWYTIKEDTYITSWKKALDAFPAEDQSPGGKWFILDYTYQPKNGKATKMQSANNLAVVHKVMGEKFKVVAEYYDELAKDWTPELARETIFANMIYDKDGLTPIVDEAMSLTRDKLAIRNQAKLNSALGIGTATQGAIAQNNNSPENIVAGFQATQAEVNQAQDEADYGVAEE